MLTKARGQSSVDLDVGHHGAGSVRPSERYAIAGAVRAGDYRIETAEDDSGEGSGGTHAYLDGGERGATTVGISRYYPVRSPTGDWVAGRATCGEHVLARFSITGSRGTQDHLGGTSGLHADPEGGSQA